MKLFYVIPVFNDESSLLELIKKIKTLNSSYDNNFLIINDASTDKFALLYNENNVTEILLKKNYGSQKAISIGLNYLFKNNIKFDYLIVMDSDGEDKPEDINVLLNEAKIKINNQIVFASRKKRRENLFFKFFYILYKITFKVCTGKKIDFGNFSCIPKKILSSIIKIPFIDYHYSAAILKSEIRYCTVSCDKGKRYSGKSNMSLINLLIHGMKSISLFLKEITLRIIMLIIILNVILLTNFELFFVLNLNCFFLTLIVTFLFYLNYLKQIQIKKNDIVNISNYYNFVKKIK